MSFELFWHIFHVRICCLILDSYVGFTHLKKLFFDLDLCLARRCLAFFLIAHLKKCFTSKIPMPCLVKCLHVYVCTLENHIDLATVQSDEDWVNLREVVQKITKMAWTGLYNDINSWRWSYQNQKIAFSTWSSGEPNNYGGYEACGLMHGSSWNDYDCNGLYPFFCFNGKK
uniref:C-type lectin domain-containing protein n=1 Tax=Sinocyclocheilus rhinocerous TaxID=307959 RepID=A0A673G433_9TELE